MTPPTSKPIANNLDAFFMPFTANRQFKKNPRMLAKAKAKAKNSVIVSKHLGSNNE